MSDVSVNDFALNIVKMGVDITQYDANDLLYLMKVAKLCLKTSGLPMGVAGGVALAGVATVTLPVLGTVPGYVAGFLGGALGGTISCSISRIAIKRGLDELLNDNSWSVKNQVIYNSNGY